MSETGDGDKGKARRRKLPRKLSARSLENAALFYLKRYAATMKQLRAVLRRKARRSLKVHGGDEAQADQWIDALLEKLARGGLLNDDAFARMKAESLRASGKSRRVIAMKLRQKGVDAPLADAHVNRVTQEISEEEAALVHARKKRLGPFRTDAAARALRRQKDLAALARAGFSYTVARKIIDSGR